MFMAWVCERCKSFHRSKANIWECPKCEKETCEDCFDRYGHCKVCCIGKSDAELISYANSQGFEF